MWIFGPPNVEKMKAKEDIKGLIKAVGYKDEDVRKAAAMALGEIGNPHAVDGLIVALQDEDEDVCKAVAGALGQIGDPRAVEPLMATLKDQNARVREAAAVALGQIGDDRAVKPLIAVLKDQDKDIREAAAGALEKLDWKPGSGQAGAWYWIAKRNWEQTTNLGSSAVKPLIATLKDENKWVRGAAAKALGQIGGAQAVKPLIAVLKDRKVDAREDAAKALGEIGDAQAINALIAALNDEKDPLLHKAAASALGKIGGTQAVEGLIAALQNWREDEVWALVGIGELAIEPLISALEGNHFSARKAAANALVKLYRNGGLGEKPKQSILAVRGMITGRHHADHDSCGHHIDQDQSDFEVQFPL